MASGKAVVINEHGGPDKLTVVSDFACRAPKAGEVLVHLVATSVNPVDVYVRNGNGPYKADSLPKVLGGDLAGTVHTAAEGSKFKAGDSVYALSCAYWPNPEFQGTYAEYAVVKEEWLANAPSSLALPDAAAVPLVALTAWQALEKAQPKAGQRVLVTGASGGVGQFAVQLAKQVHNLHVTAVCSAKTKELVQSLGPDEVIDYTTERGLDVLDFSAEADAGKKFDIIVDVIGGDMLNTAAAKALKPGGFVSAVLNRGSGTVDAHTRAQTEGCTHTYKETLVQPNGEQLTRIAELIDGGKVKLTVAQRFPLEEAGKAQDLVIEGHAGGKVVLTI